MKKIFNKSLLLLLTTPFIFYNASWSQGLKIETFKEWKEILNKAKSQNKKILVDCYTTWCGPCKMMSAKVFPQEAVGDYANDKFITVKVQFDTTAKDNEFVKATYPVAKELGVKYNIAAYPSFLVLDANGEAEHKFVGAYDAPEFIEILKESLVSDNQFYTLQKQYLKDSNNVEQLKKFFSASIAAYDMQWSDRIFNNLEKKIDNHFLNDADNIKLLTSALNSEKSTVFKYLYNNLDNSNLKDKKTVENNLSNIILSSKMREWFKSDNIDWNLISKSLNKDYNKINWTEPLANSKMTYYFYKKDYNNTVNQLVDNYSKGIKLDNNQLNAIAWGIFENVNDKQLLSKTIQTVSNQFENINQPEIIDTYANLLYKSGDRENAIKYMQKAIDIDNQSESTFKETLIKMQNNQPTW